VFTPSAPPPSLLDFIRNNAKFLVVGHREPDGDCIGSQLALASALRRLGKTALCFSAGPFKRTEIMPYQSQIKDSISAEDRVDAALIVVDCSSIERTGDIGAQLEGLPFALIDHHAAGKPSGDVRFIDVEAPATTVLIYSLIRALGLQPTATEAEFLFFGLVTDTGFFRHLDSDGVEAFSIAADLLRCGANPKKTFAAINGGKSLNSRMLLGTVLSKAEAYFDGKLIISTEKLEETQHFGLESRDSDMLYQLIQSVNGVEAIVIIRQESIENCAVGLRSRDTVDVGSVAAAMGGGGHKNAAGFLKAGTIATIKPQILAEFSKIFA
jgi:phosphoesterase RecJ-like protein